MTWPSKGLAVQDSVTGAQDELLNLERIILTATQDRVEIHGLESSVAGAIEVIDLGNNGTALRDVVDASASVEGVEVDLSQAGAQSVTGLTSAVSLALKNAEDIIGSDHNDVLILGDGGTKAEGGAGDDTLRGGAGTDTLDGGAGTDVVDYAGLSNDMVWDVAAGTVSDGIGGTDQLISIEGIIGGAGSNVLDLSGLDGGVQVSVAASGAGSLQLASGETITFQNFQEVRGASGNDTIDGGGYLTRIEGGAGDDWLVGTKASPTPDNSSILGGAGEDTLGGGFGTILRGGSESDTFLFSHVNLAADADSY